MPERYLEDFAVAEKLSRHARNVLRRGDGGDWRCGQGSGRRLRKL